MKPIGCVHCLPAAFSNADASSPEDWPVSDDLKGWFGDHQTSDDRLLPASPSASTDSGKRSALPTLTAFGLNPCWFAWFQKVVKSGGSTTPVTISAPAFLNAVICAEKSSVRSW